MKVVTDTATLDLGTTQTTPTIGITDYSVRTTDDFGVTTVVPRGFSRTLSTKMLVPTNEVDALQRSLADIRASSALWVADPRFAWMSVQGFYKDFSIELALPTISYCTLTIEGLAETEAASDPGGDPAPAGATSTLQLLQPVPVTDALLVTDSVPENDAADWDISISYAVGARVIRLATHRVYQSLTVNNQGNAPETAPGVWLDLGPTNRWAMFDQALGTATAATGSIVLTFPAGGVPALALLDVAAATIRVQVDSTVYDETQVAGPGAVTFFDMPTGGGPVTVTISGSGQVSVGTLLIGNLVALGITEASPTAGITDYSRKDVDEFGAVTIVQRAWSKQMAAVALIDIAAVDVVANRIAAVRAIPSLWLGQVGTDSLTVYGFFKDFSIEVSETTAILSLTIEGLSTAPKIDPLQIGWSNVTDDNGDLPQAGATRNVPRGEWSAASTYVQGDIVTYLGSSYLAGQNVPVGAYPTTAVYWDLLAEQGNTGGPGSPGATGPTGQAGASAFTLLGISNVALTPVRVSGVSSTAPWNGKAYTQQSYTGAAMSGFLTNGSAIGLDISPTDDASYDTVDYWLYRNPDGNIWRFRNGNGFLMCANPDASDPGATGPFLVTCDGTTVRYFYKGVQIGSHAPDAPNQTLFGVANVPNPQSFVDQIAFSAAGLAGISGGPGIPGTPGANGQPSYVHVAYADSADGSVDFVSGLANPGRVYIGIYTDNYSAGSSDYHAYNWSRLTGQDGLAGTSGTPGPVGANGAQTYVHFAYADAADGSVNFAVGAPGTRKYIGVYSDYTSASSTSYGAYTWSLIKGTDGVPGLPGTNGIDGLAALNIHTVGAVSYDGHNLTCASVAGGWTTNGAYSGNVIPGGVVLSFQRPNNYGNEDAFVGIASTPTASLDYPAVEFAWRHGQNTGIGSNTYDAEAWHAGSLLFYESWDGSYTYSIRYDNSTGAVTWYRNNVAVATYAAGTNRSFGLEVTAARNMSVANLAFTAAGGTGATGGVGAPGGNGADAYTVDLSVLAMTIAATFTGTPHAGELPRNSVLKVQHGSTDVTSSVSIALAPSSGITASVSGSSVSITGVATPGYVDVTPTYAGITLATKRIAIAILLDNAPPSSITGTSQGLNQPVSATTYDGSGAAPSFVLQTSSDGKINVTGGGIYRALVPNSGSSRITIAAKMQYRVVGTSAWTDAGSETVGEEADYFAGDGPSPGAVAVSQSITGLAATTNYEFRFNGRVSSQVNSASTVVGGTQTAAQA